MEEIKKKKKRKRRKKSDRSFYVIQGLLILAFIAVILLFIKSDYASGIFTLRREAIQTVRNSTLEDIQGQREFFAKFDRLPKEIADQLDALEKRFN